VFSSLHGEREFQEARLQAIIQKHYPVKIWDWLEWRLKNRAAPWEAGAAALGLLPARLRGGLAGGEADALIAADYAQGEQLQVAGSPTLAIGNRVYEGPLERQQILRVFCAQLETPKPAACQNVPACFYNIQCRKRGFIGRCIDAGKQSAHCDTSKAALTVPAIVITDHENIYDNHERILEILTGDLPGLDYRILDFSEPEAQTLIERGKLDRLPAYLLDPTAKNEEDYEEGAGKAAILNEALGKLMLRPASTGAHRLVARPRIKGRVDLFLSRFSKSGQEALECALEYLRTAGPAAPEIIFHDVLYWNETAPGGARELAAESGLAEIEEAARALAVKKVAPEKYLAYLLERGRRRSGSYWDTPLKALQIDPVQVRALAEGPCAEISAQLAAEADLLKSLDAGGEITLLAENCEMVPVRSHLDLRQTLERIAQRKTEP
jgi:hypothetical protein